MERLTKTYSDGTHGAADNLPCGENSYEYKGLLLEALGKYEDLEEQGRILRLPCRPNDIVYRINKEVREPIIRMSVERIVLFDNSYALEVTDKYGRHLLFMADDIGKVLYITREEAEAKLTEMEESDEGE